LLRREGLSDLMEIKPGGIAVHWRGREIHANHVARRIEQVWSELHSRRGLELLKFNGGMEIRAVSRNKGDAVRTILAEMGYGVAIAYLGDDHNDEEAFAALRDHGLSVLVQQHYRFSIADVWVRLLKESLPFLPIGLLRVGRIMIAPKRHEMSSKLTIVCLIRKVLKRVGFAPGNPWLGVCS
jgi:trehalose 6-phosphate phosphatase